MEKSLKFWNKFKEIFKNFEKGLENFKEVWYNHNIICNGGLMLWHTLSMLRSASAADLAQRPAPPSASSKRTASTLLMLMSA